MVSSRSPPSPCVSLSLCFQHSFSCLRASPARSCSAATGSELPPPYYARESTKARQRSADNLRVPVHMVQLAAQLLAELVCACLLLPFRRHTGYAGSEATVDSRCPAVSHASVQTGCSNGHRNSPVGPQRQAQCRLRLAGCSQRLEERAGCLGYESVIVVSHHVLACLSR